MQAPVDVVQSILEYEVFEGDYQDEDTALNRADK